MNLIGNDSVFRASSLIRVPARAKTSSEMEKNTIAGSSDAWCEVLIISQAARRGAAATKTTSPATNCSLVVLIIEALISQSAESEARMIHDIKHPHEGFISRLLIVHDGSVRAARSTAASKVTSQKTTNRQPDMTSSSSSLSRRRRRRPVTLLCCFAFPR